MAGLFSGIENAPVNEGGVYLTPGNYVLEVKRIKAGKTRLSRPFFVAEFKVLESDVVTRPPGIEASWMVMADQDGWQGRVKQFCSTVAGITLEEVDEAGVEGVVSEANPMKGRKLRCQAVNIVTKRGTDFTKCNFFPYIAPQN